MGNILVGGIITITVVIVIANLINRKKAGKSIGCGGNCQNCINHIDCRSKEKS